MTVATMVDHLFEPYGNPEVRSGCVRCPHPFGAHPLPVRSGRRDPEFERAFLNEAERLAGMSSGGYAEAVQDRLQRAERQYGQDSYLNLSMARLLTEIADEAFDLGGWGCMSALASYPKVADDDARGELLLILQEIASHGPLVYRLVERARDLLS